MRVFELKDKKGRVFAFEVGNTFLGRRGLYRIVSRIPGSKVLERPRTSPSGEKVLEFEVDGKKFEVIEPFGDNSRYWIGPVPPKWCEQVDPVKKVFSETSLLKVLLAF